jgi:hypothetical protein
MSDMLLFELCYNQSERLNDFDNINVYLKLA